MADLVQAATDLSVRPGRRLLGITGPPGSGKTVLAETLAAALGPRAALAPMDGFHLAGAELVRLGRTERKGAPDTFDAYGYVALVKRLRSADEPVVYAPRFDRTIEEPIAAAIEIAREVALVITEGNYLLATDEPWSTVAGLLDECWFVESDERLRLRRLIDRHVTYGRSAEQAHERATGSDARNARIVAATRSRATRVVRVPGLAVGSRT
ncbi:MAG: nucleoside/nucleotide kinase family protein [Actinobacteria bacterium]|nr:nucleoside/nucleotide kinase family protein [Actinomycetota bacterium]